MLSELMLLLGWRSCKHMLFLALDRRGPDEHKRNKWRGSRGSMTSGSQREERDVKGPNKFHRRGEGGEGRARLQVCDQRILFFSPCSYSADTLHPSP